MTTTSVCNNLNADPKILENLSRLNTTLLNLAKDMLIDIEKLSVEDMKLSGEVDHLKSSISQQIKKLKHDKNQFDKGKTDNLENGEYDEDEDEDEDDEDEPCAEARAMPCPRVRPPCSVTSGSAPLRGEPSAEAEEREGCCKGGQEAAPARASASCR